MSTFPPITHVAVTVSDLETSVSWYTRLFDAGPVLDEDTGPFRHVVWAIGETLFGVHLFPDTSIEPAGGAGRVGLDHIAFAAQDRAELEKWAVRLDELGIVHGSIEDAGYGSGLSFRDPDNIPLEFFAPPAA